MPVANRDLIRAINQFNILNAIRKEKRISRIEIARLTGLSQASVTGITAQLIEEKIIFEKEVEDTNSRGRRRIFLALNLEAVYVVGVKISAFEISVVITNMQADIISAVTIPVRTSKRSVEFVADLMEDGIRHCVEGAKLTLNQISGIGIGIPGFIDSHSGICHWTPLYKRGKIPIRKMIQDRLKINTYIENDANTITLAEQWFGQGSGVDNFLVVTIEHGIGMGIILNGQMYRGVQGMGAECGHMVIVPDGAQCRCGKKGCLEAYVSDVAILERAKKALENKEWTYETDRQLTIEMVTDLARYEQPVLKKIFREAGKILGVGLSNLIHIFNPQKIIITGEGVRAGNLLFDSMNSAVKNYAHKKMLDSMEILVQDWDDMDWARGAASLVLQELYRSPFNSIKPVI